MEKSIITFSANEQNLQKTGGIGCYASDTVSYIEAHFALGENWSGYDSIRAVWFNDYKAISTVLDFNGVCIVPHEVLTSRGKVMVNLVGSVLVSDELKDRLTTFPCEALKVSAKAKISGSETAEVTPSQFEQFVEAVKDNADRAEAGAGEAKDEADRAESEADQATASAQASEASALRASGHAQNAQSAETSARAYAQNAQNYATDAENAKDDAIDARDEIRSMRANAETLEPNQSATASYSNGVLTLGIPKGQKGDTGETGETGDTPNISVGNVTTLEPSEDAYVTRRGTDDNPIFDFGIPKGDTGTVPDLDLILPTDTASGDIASITDGQSVVPVKSLKVTLEPIQSGSGTPSPDNVRPISGHTECVTEVCGKNLLNPTLYSGGQYNPSVGTRWTLTESAEQFENPSEGVFTLLCPTTWMQRVLVFEMPDDEADYYLRLARSSTGDCGATIGWLDADYTVLIVGNYTNASYEHSFALANRPSGAKYYYITLTNRGTANAILTVTNPQIELGSTATDYEPYQGTSYTTTLGRTVYGGTLDVVSGELVVDRAMVDLGTLDWEYNVSNLGAFHSTTIATLLASRDNSICSDYPVNLSSSSSSAITSNDMMLFINKGRATTGSLPIGAVVVRDSRYTDAAAFKTAMDGVQLVYELATPQTYQLDPQTISLLHGNNNVWSDGSVEVTYNADVGLYIDKKLGTSGTRTLSMTRTLAKSEDTDDTKSDNIQLAED